MSFVDQSQALERERRMQTIMDRLNTLSDSELENLDRNLGVQVLIDDAKKSQFPINTVSSQTTENNTKILLSCRIETVRSNLTQILSFTPTDSDIQELIKIRNVYGGNFTSAIRQISSVQGSIPTGTSDILKLIDTGNTSVVNTSTRIAQEKINEANTTIISANTESVVSANSALALRTSGFNITSLLNNPTQLITSLAGLFSEDMDSKIKKIDSELDAISRDSQEAAKQRSDSNISTQNADLVRSNIEQALSMLPSNPDPVSEDGTPYYTYPNST